MDWWEKILWILLFVFYIFCLMTVCRLTFSKGYKVLGIVGIFLPFLWLIGAVLPAKDDSAYAKAQQAQVLAQQAAANPNAAAATINAQTAQAAANIEAATNAAAAAATANAAPTVPTVPTE